MSRHIDRAKTTVRGIVEVAQEEQLTFLAAGIAYYGFVSLIPLLLLVLVVGSLVGDQTLSTMIIERTGEVLSPSGQDILGNALDNASGRGGATVVGLVGLLWSVLKVFRGMDTAFSEIYGTEQAEGLLGQLRDGIIVLGAIIVGLLGLSILAGIATLAASPLLQVLAPFGFLLALLVAFFPLYYVFPDADVTPREALPGTGLAAIGGVALAGSFSLYAEVAGSFAVYGVLGAALLVVTFLYFGAILLLIGAALNAVLARKAPASTGNFNTDTDET